MENIFGVTEYLPEQILARGGDADAGETLSYLKTKAGEPYYEDADGSPWRCYNFIADSVCIESVRTRRIFDNSEKALVLFCARWRATRQTPCTRPLKNFTTRASAWRILTRPWRAM